VDRPAPRADHESPAGRRLAAAIATVVGETIAATRMYYDFKDNASGTVAVVGLVDDDRVASITLSRKGRPDTEAVLDAGTFVIPAVVGLEANSPSAHLVVRDAAANELERLPYRQNN
jgi:hypothetical protein